MKKRSAVRHSGVFYLLGPAYFVARTFLSFANLGRPFSSGGRDSPWIRGSA